MIVVDSSVWIEHSNDVESQQTASLRRLIGGDVSPCSRSALWVAFQGS